MDTKDEEYQEKWIVYGTNNLFSAKELTVFPEKSVKIKDNGPYGLIVIQGHGSVEKLPVESPAIIKYNDLTYDELTYLSQILDKKRKWCIMYSNVTSFLSLIGKQYRR